MRGVLGKAGVPQMFHSFPATNFLKTGVRPSDIVQGKQACGCNVEEIATRLPGSDDRVPRPRTNLRDETLHRRAFAAPLEGKVAH